MSQIPRQQKKIVVVAEDATAGSRAVAVLEQVGYLVAAGQDSLDVLALVDRQAPDVIVLTVALPTGLGLEMLQALRRGPDRTNHQAILMSAGATLVVDAETQCVKTLADRPIDATELVALVDELALVP